MDRDNVKPMTPFDSLISNTSMQMMKLMIPYMPPSSQRLLGIYIKFQELQLTMDYFQNFRQETHSQSFSSKSFSITALLEDILPYLSPKDASAIEDMTNMMNMMEMMKSMQAGASDGQGGGMDPMMAMMGMLSPDQKEMFETYQEMFANTDTNKGSAESESNSFGTENFYEREDNND